MKYDIYNKDLHRQGQQRIEWALERMPVLELIRKRFVQEKPLRGVTIGACLHVTTETAALMITLKEAGARVILCASNPLSTQDDTAASLVHDYDIAVFARKGEDNKRYYAHIEAVLKERPLITLDDGADLISTVHKKFYAHILSREELPKASTEETTTGVIRLRALEQQKKLLYPIIAVNDAYTKHLFDNRYGTGQSTMDGILRATNKLIAGMNFVIGGYGWCSKGIAQKARGLGAQVIVTEVDPLRALEAVMDGFRVLPMRHAARIADIIVTATGNIDIVGKAIFPLMKDKVLLANSGHFNVELDLVSLKKMAKKIRTVKPALDEYVLRGGKRIYVLAEGRLVNLACAEGHPAEVMDMSFANQALSCEYIMKNSHQLSIAVRSVPAKIDAHVAKLKLDAMGIPIDALTGKQQRYLVSWSEGT